MNNKKAISILLVILAYILSTGISAAFFSKNSGVKKAVAPALPSATTTGGGLKFSDTLPKTEACPLNGNMYSKDQKKWWESHRPLGVMIENHKEARPQSGLSGADVIYEAVAEGGITRFLAVFYCNDAGEIGPVRSARTYFVDFISEYGNYPLYAHVGGANQPGPANALGQIEDYGWGGFNDLNQFSIGFPTFWRDYDRLGHPAATEHTMYSTTQKLWDYAATSRKLTNVDGEGTKWDSKFVSYGFADDAVLSARPKSQSIHLEFWKANPDYFVDWAYDPISNTYKRNGGSPYIDRDNNQQLTTKNIVVLSMVESGANDGYVDNDHLLYKTKGVGKASIIKDGKQIVGTWRKDSRTSRTLIFDAFGDPIKFDRGLIWFEILPTDGVLTVK